MKQLQTLIFSNPNKLPKAELMKMFNAPGDVCGRKDTDISDGYLINEGSGATCDMRTEIPGVSGVTIQLPKIFKGKVDIEAEKSL